MTTKEVIKGDTRSLDCIYIYIYICMWVFRACMGSCRTPCIKKKRSLATNTSVFFSTYKYGSVNTDVDGSIYVYVYMWIGSCSPL